MNAAKRLLLKKQLSGSCLSQEQLVELVNRNFKVQEYDGVNKFDGALLDAVKEMMTSYPEFVKGLKAFCRKLENQVNKQFYHTSKIIEQWEGFVVTTSRQDRRHDMDMRVANKILRIVCPPRALRKVRISRGMDLHMVFEDLSTGVGALGQGSKAEFSTEMIEKSLEIKARIRETDPKDLSSIWIPATSGHRCQISGYAEGTSDPTKFYVSSDGKVWSAVKDPVVPETYYVPTGKVKQKDRLVWVIDGGTVLVEAQYAVPVQEYMMKSWYNFGGTVMEDIRELFSSRTKRLRFPQWYALDYSSYDQSVPAWVISMAFDYIKEFFPNDPEAKKELSWIAQNFIHTRIVLPTGELVQKHRGVPSGSRFTALVDSLCNFFMFVAFMSSRCRKRSDLRGPGSRNLIAKIDYVFEELGFWRGSALFDKHKDLAVKILGDDITFMTLHPIDLKSFEVYVDTMFGMKMKADKCKWDYSRNQAPFFLKRWWLPDGTEYYPLELILINVLHPEHDRTYEGYSPWHILYGLFTVYRGAFKGVTTERYLIQKMMDNGGVDALQSLKRQDLPGSLRAFPKEAVGAMLRRARNISRRIEKERNIA